MSDDGVAVNELLLRGHRRLEMGEKLCYQTIKRKSRVLMW